MRCIVISHKPEGTGKMIPPIRAYIKERKVVESNLFLDFCDSLRIPKENREQYNGFYELELTEEQFGRMILTNVTERVYAIYDI